MSDECRVSCLMRGDDECDDGEPSQSDVETFVSGKIFVKTPGWGGGEFNLLVTPYPHEFHMIDVDNAYCLCGWEATNDWSNVTEPAPLGKRYREHLK